jgi:hypothetical protein
MSVTTYGSTITEIYRMPERIRLPCMCDSACFNSARTARKLNTRSAQRTLNRYLRCHKIFTSAFVR